MSTTYFHLLLSLVVSSTITFILITTPRRILYSMVSQAASIHNLQQKKLIIDESKIFKNYPYNLSVRHRYVLLISAIATLLSYLLTTPKELISLIVFCCTSYVFAVALYDGLTTIIDENLLSPVSYLLLGIHLSTSTLELAALACLPAAAILCANYLTRNTTSFIATGDIYLVLCLSAINPAASLYGLLPAVIFQLIFRNQLAKLASSPSGDSKQGAPFGPSLLIGFLAAYLTIQI